MSSDSPHQRRSRHRIPKACHSCRKRKVRCDYGQPCETCVQRRQPQLCVYDSRRGHVSSIDNVEGIFCTAIDNDSGKHQAQRMLAIMDHIGTHAISSCNTDVVSGQATYIGRNSHAALFRALLESLPADTLPPDVSIEAAFGVINRRNALPFASLWNATARVTLADIVRSFPPAETCLRYYRSYLQFVHPFFPFLCDVEVFERFLCQVLEQLGNNNELCRFSNSLAANTPCRDLARYALLFAVLASGCQVSQACEHEDELTMATRVFVACSFDCLRLANFYISPSPETMQTGLILQNVSCNDSNPGAAIESLGHTARQAQSLGLHTRSGCSCQLRDCLCIKGLQPLWKATLFLDITLSMAYDRMPATFIPNHDLIHPLVWPPHLVFWDCMFALRCLQNRWQSDISRDSMKPIQWDRIESTLASTSRLAELARSDKSSLCRAESVQASLEQLIFTVHFEHFEATVFFHAALSTTSSTESRLQYCQDMTSRFCSVIEAYLKLRPLSPLAKVAWDIHNAVVTSALLLAALGTVLQSRISRQALHQLSVVLLASAPTSSERREETTSLPWNAGIETLKRLLQSQYK